MRRRDVVISVLVSIVLLLASWPYQVDYSSWVDSPAAWVLSAVLGLAALILMFVFYSRSRRAIASGPTEDHERAGPR